MLNIYLGDMKEAVYHHPTYFDNMYEDEWITNPLSVEMIFDVDKSLRKESKVVQTKKQYGDFSLTALSDPSPGFLLSVNLPDFAPAPFRSYQKTL